MNYVIGYPDKSSMLESLSEMSDGTVELFKTFMLYLTSRSNNVAFTIMSEIGNILPYALTVAGAILVVKLGWRLFRNFTKG